MIVDELEGNQGEDTAASAAASRQGRSSLTELGIGIENISG